MSGIDYGATAEVTPEIKNEEMAKLNVLVGDARQLEVEIAEATATLKTKQEKLRSITWTAIPELMERIGLQEVKTQAGVEVRVFEEVESGISEENRSRAIGWLELNGHKGLIKSEIKVAFNRDQREEAETLIKELSTKFPGVAAKATVHPQTLKAWVKEMLAGGKDIPLDLFGVFKRKVAKLS